MAEHRRAAGVLLHPTSLPGRFGIGDLGDAVGHFLDWAQTAGQTLWQILPLGPPEAGNSPYNCLSAFAGNPLLISPERLREEDLLDADELDDAAPPAPGRVDYGAVGPWKERLLRRSWERFRDRPRLREALEQFSTAPEQQDWLDDWALFSALRRRFDRRGWWDWEPALARREPAALAAARRDLEEEIAYHRYVQLLFFDQWERVRTEVRRRGMVVLGDLPIYVALNSAEVWAHPDLFDLDDAGRPRSVAGVPPDYFSETGQLWGNPLYRWDRMHATGYAWWCARMAANLRLVDLVRLDHFRGFAGYWQVPAGEETAIPGRWVEGPGMALFAALRKALGTLPVVAEDLGHITPDVDALRRELAVPGMHVLQFGFHPDSAHAVHHQRPASVVYTGTHDNDTTVGWYRELPDEDRQTVRDLSGGRDRDIHWALIRLAYTSVAELAVVPVQDVLGLGSEARMNIPGSAEGNWTWRLEPGQPSAEPADRLRRLAELSARWPSSRGSARDQRLETTDGFSA